MKKKTLLAFIIMLATVITSFSVSNTYAKYSSSVELGDEARVAKWDVHILNLKDGKAVDTVNLFDFMYSDGDVRSTNGEKVIGPGAKGEYEFTITGAPETNYKLNIQLRSNICVLSGSEEIVNSDECLDFNKDYKQLFDRITYRLNDYAASKEYSTLDALSKGLNGIFEFNHVYRANTLPDPFYDYETNESISHKIYWEWKIEDNDEANENDRKAIEEILKDNKFKLQVEITATQSNEAAN